MEKISETKNKREFRGLPDSVVKMALDLNNWEVKGARSLLRKYYGVFLTNKVLKGHAKSILKDHRSSKNRDYTFVYGEIFKKRKKFDYLIDLGCGVNGFSIKDGCAKQIVNYLGFEASNDLVRSTNEFFEKEGIGKSAKVIWGDLFDMEKLRSIIKLCSGSKVIFLFQIVDALEGLKKNYSKDVLRMIRDLVSGRDLIVLSVSLKSLGNGRNFNSKRVWLKSFLKEEFEILNEFSTGFEHFYLFRKK